jgi:hypothetical protein
MKETPDGSGQPVVDPKDGAPAAEPDATGADSITPSIETKVKLSIGGKEFEVSPELAESIDNSTSEREKEFSRKLSERGDELGKLRKEKEAVAGHEAEAAELGDLLFSDPDKFVVRVQENIQKSVKDASEDIYSRITSASEAKGRESKFWERFYGKYPDLKKAKFLVEARLNKDMGELGNLSVDKAIDELGKRLRVDLTSLGVTPKGDTVIKGKGNLNAEGESAVNFSAGGIEPPKDRKTLSDIIKGRRKSRHIS